MGINYEYLSRIRPLNEEEPSTMPELGRMPSNSGNVEDFNDKNSELSQGTAGLLSSMRMQREVEKREKATPLSEKLFRIEMANRQAKQKAAMYIKERQLNLLEEKMQYDRIKDSAALAKAEADKEELRAKEKAKAELDLNSKYLTHIKERGIAPDQESRAEFESLMAGQIPQTQQTERVQEAVHPEMDITPQKKTIGQQMSYWKSKNKQSGGPDLKSANVALNLSNHFQGSETYKKFEETMDYANKAKMIQDELSKGEYGNLSAIDTSIGYIFNKAQDPSSVVREGEFDRTFKGMPLFGKLKGKFKQIAEGGLGLDNETRIELIRMIPNLLESTKKVLKSRYENVLKPQIDEYNKKGFDINETMVLGNLSSLLQDKNQQQPTNAGTQPQPESGKKVRPRIISKEAI